MGDLSFKDEGGDDSTEEEREKLVGEAGAV